MLILVQSWKVRASTRCTHGGVTMRACAVLAASLTLFGCGSENADGETDANTDTGECTPMTTDSHCNAIDQCGCEYDDWCCFVIHSRDGATCDYYGAACCSAGSETINLGDECTFPPALSRAPRCRPGSVCLPDAGSGIATCIELCRTGSDCSSGDCIPGPDVLVPTDYPHCAGGSTIPMHYSICSG
jgi:hypothetical protein